MKTRRRNYSDDPLTITQLNNRSKETSVNVTIENSEDSTIPIDFIFEILSRLPAKSVARCRCLSKLWSSRLRCPYFTELFLTRSRNRPQLLFAVQKHDKLLFLSSPQPQNPDVNSSTVVCATRLMQFPFNGFQREITGPVHGLVYFTERLSRKELKMKTVRRICNPSTGQSLLLPKLKTRTRRVGVKSFFGYVAIDKQFKLLCIASTRSAGNHRVYDEYQILNIGTEQWRIIECSIPPHHSLDKGICINGVLYYRARFSEESMLVCFDFSSEKFRYITIVGKEGIMVNYNGKLGLLDDVSAYVAGNSSIVLWVLEDSEKKQEWSKQTFVLPTKWQEMIEALALRIVGLTRRNEIVFSAIECMPFCVFYYSIERNTIVKVGIRGLEAFEDSQVDLYLDHVEDVKLM